MFFVVLIVPIAMMKTQHFITPLLQHSRLIAYLSSCLKYALILISLFFIVVFLWTTLHRIIYPYELEWMEGAMVDECVQVLNGQPLYRAPSMGYIPFIYPPLYFFLSSLLMSVLGIGFFAPRLVSLCSSAGILVLLFSIVKRETRRASAGILAAGLFAASYNATGAWMDIARVDSLFLFWVTLAVLIAGRRKAGAGNAVLGAAVISAAFFTKQVALAPALAIGLYYLVSGWKRALIYLGTLALIAGGGTLLLNARYGGWYSYYVFFLSSRHVVRTAQIREFLSGDVMGTFPVMFVLSLVSPLLLMKNRRSLREDATWLLYYPLGASLFLVSLVGRGNVNSYINTLLPAALAFALLCGWVWGRISDGEGRGPALLGPVVSICLALQFVILGYLPVSRIPRPGDRLAGDRLIAYMKSVEGEVLLPFHGYLPRLAGKESAAHWTAALDLLLAMGSSPEDPARSWLAQFEESLREGRYECIILDREDWFPDLLKERYRREGNVFEDGTVFFPVTGYPWRPQYIYRKINSPPR